MEEVKETLLTGEACGADDWEEPRLPKKGERLEWLLGNLYDCAEFLTACWAFLMLTLFPLYAPERYHDLGAYKFSFFAGISTLLLVPGAVLGVIWLLGKKDRKRSVSVLDLAVAAYLLANLLSFCLSEYSLEAWEGVGGWNMGAKTQIFMVLAYFMISRFFPWKKGSCLGEGGQKEKQPGKWTAAVMGGALAGSGLTFLLGILHRFQIDPLGMYEGIDGSYKILFLSTVGQATWYSSYVCTVFPIGLCIFCFSEKRRTRILTGSYCALGFMTLVTQNSDSAFAALAFLFLGLFVACCVSEARMERFLEAVILCAVSFKAVGFAQRCFAQQAVELGSLSTAFSQGAVSWVMLLAAAGAYLWLLHSREREGEGRAAFSGKAGREAGGRQQMPSSAASKEAVREQEAAALKWNVRARRLQAVAVAAAVAGAAGSVCLIALNTAGVLERGFGFTSQNSYLLFDDRWGSSRGFTWKTSVELFREMPFWRRLVGAGPDCFMPYSYGIPEYAERLNDYWKPDVLTNAHNEFLNLLICVGIVGLAAFLLVLGAAAVRFYRIGKKRPFALIGLLTVCAYAAHNFFCYQQVCCTPFLFLILGLAERLAREEAGLTGRG